MSAAAKTLESMSDVMSDAPTTKAGAASASAPASAQAMTLDENEAKAVDNADKDRIIKLISKPGADGKSAEINIKLGYALQSELLKTALVNDHNAKELETPQVAPATLAKVVEYLNHHQGVAQPIIEKPLKSKVLADVVADKWDATYIDEIGKNRQFLYDIILAANYMNIKPLLHLACAKVASLVKGQPLEKIKEILDPKVAGVVAGVMGSQQAAAAPMADNKDEKEQPKPKSSSGGASSSDMMD